ncbi:MAG: Ig-like domain-containing protein, partial [Anaerolineales bacterium]|nr:Ig-like domain-containing protein [Anaerolineales bacterium]
LSLATSYNIEIASSALSANGAANLEGFSFSRFSTVPFPAVIRTQPGNNAQADPFANGVDITFASPMDFATLEDRIAIEPEPDEVQYFEGLANLFIRFDMEPRTEYTVTVPGSAADPYGNTLGEPYTWRFTIAGRPPLVSLNLPLDRLAQFSSSFPTDVQLAYRNVSQIDISLYEMDFPFVLLLSPQQYDNEFLLQPADQTWSIETPATDTAAVFDLQLADGAALPNGIYFLRVSSPSLNSDSQFWQNQGSFLVVADTNLVVKETFGAVYVWATDLASGLPVSGRAIDIYSQQDGFMGSGTTNSDGLAIIDYEPSENYLAGVVAVTGTPGGANYGVAASSWSARTEGWSFGLANDWGEQPEQETYIFTDRPIYRPGDTLYFQGYVRQTNYGRYTLPATGEAELTLQPNFYLDGPTEPVSLPVTIDELGGFAGEFNIPEGYPLGTYGLQFTGGSYNAYRQITVAEYRAPEFLVTVTPEVDETLRGEEVDVTIETSYFFGGPAADLNVQWNVTVNSYILPFEGRYYSFTEQDSYFYDPFNFSGFGGRWLLGGEGVTDGNGQLKITLPADLLAEMPDGSHTITVEALVADISEFLVVSRNDVTFHAAEQYVGIVPAESLVQAGLEASVDLLTTDWESEPAASIPVEVVFYKREWERVRNNQFGQYITQWEPVDTEIERVEATTDNRGEASASFVPPEGGSYYIVATLTDSGGRQQSSSTYLWALDESFAGWRTDPAEKRMDLIADKREYNSGDTATILVQ